MIAQMKHFFVLMVSVLVLSTCSVEAQHPTSPEAEGPRVFCLSRELLVKTKARIQAGEDDLQRALGKLRKEADEALKTGPFSVIHKTIVPPSDDKHDYLSFGPYWWPHPTTKDGLPYIWRDGQTNPASKTDSDSVRQSAMVASVATLALAYYLTEQEAYARRAVWLLRTW